MVSNGIHPNRHRTKGNGVKSGNARQRPLFGTRGETHGTVFVAPTKEMIPLVHEGDLLGAILFCVRVVCVSFLKLSVSIKYYY